MFVLLLGSRLGMLSAGNQTAAMTGGLVQYVCSVVRFPSGDVECRQPDGSHDRWTGSICMFCCKVPVWGC